MVTVSPGRISEGRSTPTRSRASPNRTLVGRAGTGADRSLIAASLTDRCRSGFSGVYKFFDPADARRSLGSLIILWHVGRAIRLELPYVYLGYWIAGSQKMAYKARFQPLEQLTPSGWQPMSATQGAADVADRGSGTD